MAKNKQTTNKNNPTTIHPKGQIADKSIRTRDALRNGVGSGANQMNLINAWCRDTADNPADIDPNNIFKAIGKAQNLVGLAIREAAEARRNPNYRSVFLLEA